MPTLNPALEALIRKDEQKRGGLYSAVIVEISAQSELSSEALRAFNEKLWIIKQITDSSDKTRNPMMISVSLMDNTIWFVVNPLAMFKALSSNSYTQTLTEQLLSECSELCHSTLNRDQWKITFHNLS